jgi:hypothetical protein
MDKKKKKENKTMSTNDALKSRGNLKDVEKRIKNMKPGELGTKIKGILKDFDVEKDKPKGYDKRKKKELSRGRGGGGGGGLSFKHYLEGNLPGRKKYKSGGIVKKNFDGIAKRGKTKGRMI